MEDTSINTNATPNVAATPSVAESSPSSDVSSSKRKADSSAEGSESRPPPAAREGEGNSSKRGRGGSFRGGRGGGRGGGGSHHADSASSAASTLPRTPLQQQFAIFAAYLDQRNDRRELIYQSSRDLTRQSKKLISSLQRCTYAHNNPTEKAAILKKAESELEELHHMLAATVEGFNEDDYTRFGGAFSPGFQEFIESASFLHYLQTGGLITQGKLEEDIQRTVGRAIKIPLSDYIVGILDLGGELMRFATNSLSSGAVGRKIVSDICLFLREVYAEYQKLILLTGNGGPFREISKKMEVWLASLMKIEALSYKLHIRGAEIKDEKLLSAMLLNELQQPGQQEAAGGGEE